MSLSGAFNRFADRAANGICNVELSEIEAVLGSLSLCEVPAAECSRCCEGESVRAVAIHYVAGAIQAATEIALRAGNEMAIVVPSLVCPSLGGAWCKRNNGMELSKTGRERDAVIEFRSQDRAVCKANRFRHDQGAVQIVGGGRFKLNHS